MITSALSPNAAPTCVVPSRRRPLTSQHMLRLAMADNDHYVIEFRYVDSKGKRTRRTVSPIRFAGADRFLGLCLCREEPRQFHLSRCDEFRLIAAEDVLMPVEIVELDRLEMPASSVA